MASVKRITISIEQLLAFTHDESEELVIRIGAARLLYARLIFAKRRDDATEIRHKRSELIRQYIQTYHA